MSSDSRERKGKRERDLDVREKHRLVASHMHSNQESNPQLRYVPWLEIEPPTFWCTGQCSYQLSCASQGLILNFRLFYCPWDPPPIQRHRSSCQRVELVPLSKLLRFCLWEKRLSHQLQRTYKHRVQEEPETTLKSQPSPYSTVPIQGTTSQRAEPSSHRREITLRSIQKLKLKESWDDPSMEARSPVGREPPGVGGIWTHCLSWQWFTDLSAILNPQLTTAGHRVRAQGLSVLPRSQPPKSCITPPSLMTGVEASPATPSLPFWGCLLFFLYSCCDFIM